MISKFFKYVKRKIKSTIKGFIFLIFLGLLVYSYDETKTYFSYTEPLKQTCNEFLASPKENAWVKLTGCNVELAEIASDISEKGKDGKLSVAYLPIIGNNGVKSKDLKTKLYIIRKDRPFLDKLEVLVNGKVPEDEVVIKGIELIGDYISSTLTGVVSRTNTLTLQNMNSEVVETKYYPFKENEMPKLPIGPALWLIAIALVYWVRKKRIKESRIN